MTRLNYGGLTNTCLLFCIVSAFGFDQNGHPLWLGLGGIAGLVAIALHFRRHWQASVVHEDLVRQDEEQTETPIAEYGTHPHHSHPDWNEIVAINRRLASFYFVGRYREPDPAEQALRIIKELRAHERPTEVAIGGDGSVTLRFRRGTEQRQPVLPLEIEMTGQDPETVH